MRDLLIVDGYNFIFNFFKASKMKNDKLEILKNKLIDDLAAYNSQNDYDIMLVFDASKSENNSRSSTFHDHIQVIHSRKGETADSVIEEIVSRFSPDRKVIVVTSDYSQQKVVFGKNTIRRSSREFGLELKAAKLSIKNRIKKTKKMHYPIENRLDPETRKKIFKFRKK